MAVWNIALNGQKLLPFFIRIHELVDNLNLSPKTPVLIQRGPLLSYRLFTFRKSA